MTRIILRISGALAAAAALAGMPASAQTTSTQSTSTTSSSAGVLTTSSTGTTSTTSTKKPTTATADMINEAIQRSEARAAKEAATGTPQQWGSEEAFTYDPKVKRFDKTMQ